MKKGKCMDKRKLNKKINHAAKNKYKKGQTYSIEMIFVVIIAVILIYTLLSIFQTMVKENRDKNKDYIVGFFDADSIVWNRGIPKDWESNVSQLKVLGLVSERNVIDDSKIAALSQIPQEDLSYILHLDKYNISISILVDGNVYYQIGNLSENVTITQIERSCVFSNGTPCLLRLRYSEKQ